MPSRLGKLRIQVGSALAVIVPPGKNRLGLTDDPYIWIFARALYGFGTLDYDVTNVR